MLVNVIKHGSTSYPSGCAESQRGRYRVPVKLLVLAIAKFTRAPTRSDSRFLGDGKCPVVDDTTLLSEGLVTWSDD